MRVIDGCTELVTSDRTSMHGCTPWATSRQSQGSSCAALTSRLDLHHLPIIFLPLEKCSQPTTKIVSFLLISPKAAFWPSPLNAPPSRGGRAAWDERWPTSAINALSIPSGSAASMVGVADFRVMPAGDSQCSPSGFTWAHGGAGRLRAGSFSPATLAKAWNRRGRYAIQCPGITQFNAWRPPGNKKPGAGLPGRGCGARRALKRRSTQSSDHLAADTAVRSDLGPLH